jgi:ketosteroid isomerase-like protein
MSQQNVKIVSGMYEAFGRGDIPSIITALHSQVEWWEAENFIYADKNPYVGPGAVLEGVFKRIVDDWDGFQVAPKELLDAGDTVIGHGYYSGTYKRTGRRVKAQFAHFFTFRDDKVARFQQYTDTAQFQNATRELTPPKA